MRRLFKLVLPVLLVTLAIGFTPWLSQEAGETTGENSQSEPVEKLWPELPRSIPDEARQVKNPIEPTQGALASGQRLYTSQCSVCHGMNGAGVQGLPAGLSKRVPDFTREGWQAARTDGELYYIITEGHGRMRGQKNRLRDEFKWNLIHHVRTFGK
jgi:mono/diheme cytochrome c family protein